MIVSPLWRGPGNTHNFGFDGQSYRPGWDSAQTPTEPTVACVGIKTVDLLSVRHYHYRLRLVAPCQQLDEVDRHSSSASCAFKQTSFRYLLLSAWGLRNGKRWLYGTSL